MEYDYGEKNGPHTWALRYQAAGGCRQSPINLNTAAMVYDGSLKALDINLNGIEKQKIDFGSHNFHVKIEGNGAQKISVLRGGPLDSDYHLTQFHFHWGSGNTWGSEHQVNGVSSPSELHLVFVNSKYGHHEKVMEMSDGLAVVGVFLQLGEERNPAMEQLCNLLPSVDKGKPLVITPNLPLQSLIPKDTSKYYTYPGSLTTPPCSECVTWLVLDEPIIITQRQLDVLRSVHSNCQFCKCTDNYRPVCPVGSRKVRTTVRP